MNRNCHVCNINKDENRYLEDRTVCKTVTIEIEEKTIKITP